MKMGDSGVGVGRRGGGREGAEMVEKGWKRRKWEKLTRGPWALKRSPD